MNLNHIKIIRSVQFSCFVHAFNRRHPGTNRSVLLTHQGN